jgi:hypothetical protein
MFDDDDLMGLDDELFNTPAGQPRAESWRQSDSWVIFGKALFLGIIVVMLMIAFWDK